MLKMIIRMDDDKINIEKKYRLDGIYRTLDSTFVKMGLPRMEDSSGSLVYRDNGHTKDYGRFGKIVNTLKKQAWFMDNVKVWLLCDSDDSDSSDDFNVEDLLSHYRQKFPWIGNGVNKIDVTNIGRQHDLTELLKPTAPIEIDSSILLTENTESATENGH